MSKIIYKHKKTEDLVIKKGNYFHFLNDECPSEENKLPKLMVIGSSDWELITCNGRESYELLLDDSNEIYFKSIVTEQEYRIGDKITIQQNVSFGDGKRNFVIRNWYLSSTPVERNIFSYVYVITECDGRSIHLDDIIVKEK
jgi:hypothetical protein